MSGMCDDCERFKAERDEARRERDEKQAVKVGWMATAAENLARAEAAEAEVARLREALRDRSLAPESDA